MKELKVVSVDELHNIIRNFIIESDTIIGDYEDMKTLILNMVRAGYMFNMDRDRLRDAMEDITFMLCPDDDANKDRVERYRLIGYENRHLNTDQLTRLMILHYLIP